MIAHPSIPSLGLSLLSFLSLSPVSSALTWDSNAAEAPNPNDGSGTWLDEGRWWDGTTHVTWSNTTHGATTAVFGSGGTSGDINLTGGVSAGGLRLESVSSGTGYRFQNGTLTLTDGALIDIYSGSSGAGGADRIRFTSPIAGSNITITNANQPANFESFVTLGGANTWTGTLTLQGNPGVDGETGAKGLFLNMTNASGLQSLSEVSVKPNTTLAIEVSAGASIAVPTLRIEGNGAENRGAIRFDHSASVSSNIILTEHARISTAANAGTVVTLSGAITGTGKDLSLNNGAAMTGRIIFTNTTSNFNELIVTKSNAQIGQNGVGSAGSGIIRIAGTDAIVSGSGIQKSGILVSNGTIRPGDNGGADIGSLRVNGNLNFTGLSGLSAPRTVAEFTLGADNLSDQLNVTGNLRLHGNGNLVLTFDSSYTEPVVGDTWTIFTYLGNLETTVNGFSMGENFRTGRDSDGNEGNIDLPDISAWGYQWQYEAGTSNSAMTFIIVPEPSTSLLSLGTAFLAFLRRRR